MGAMGPLMRTDREYARDVNNVGAPRARFCPPRSTSALIERPLLTARVENGGKLTLLLAPPGSGKSTLLAQWSDHSHTKHRVAWLLCGQRDQEAGRFFASLAASVDERIGELITPVSAVDALCDRLSALQEELVIAIDDLQFVDCAESEHTLWSLIAQSSPCVRWI